MFEASSLTDTFILGKIDMFKKLALPALALFALQAQPAHAALITFNATIDANAIINVGTIPITLIGGSTIGTQRFQIGSNQGGPFSAAINQGDVLETNVTVINGAWTLESGPQAGSDEILFQSIDADVFNPPVDNPNQDPVMEITRTHELIVHSSTGDLNVVSPFTNTQTLTTAQFSNFFTGNITDSAVSLTSFTLRTTYDSITFLSPFDQQLSLPINVTTNGIISLDQRVLDVPAPGALALLGFGLLGLGLRRRTK